MPKRTRFAADSPAGQADAVRSASVPSTSASGAASSTRQQSSHSVARRSGSLGYKSTSYKDPQRKRLRPTKTLPFHSLEGSLSEEVLLRCLSFLPAHDLVTVSRVSSAWYRLAQDPQLWRSLYLRTYASPSVRRQAALGAHVQRARPWRELYQISTNWRNGNARATTLGTNLRRAVLPEAPPLDAVASTSFVASPPDQPVSIRPSTPADTGADTQDTLLQFHQQFILSASRSPDPVPTVTVHQALPSGASAVVGSFGSERLADFYAERPGFKPSFSLTEMRLEEAVSPGASILLCALFYSTGQYALFRLTLPDPAHLSRPFEAREVYTSLATGLAPHYQDPTLSYRTSSPFDPVTTARLHWPLLVTLTESLTMRFLRLSWHGDRLDVDETETPLQSRERWAPVVLNLDRLSLPDKVGAPEMFRVSLAYSTPIFPASWTVGLQQFDVSVPLPPSVPLRICARHATAAPAYAPLPSTTRRTAPLAASESSSPSRPFLPPALPPSPVTSIEHSHPFIVTSRIDNTIDVYEVVSFVGALETAGGSVAVLPSHRVSDRAAEPLHLVPRRTLFGHTARVASVALLPYEEPTASVRCISAGDDGAVKVWHLEPSRGAAEPTVSPIPVRKRAADLDLDIRQAHDELESTTSSENGHDNRTEWQQLKRRRLAASSNSRSKCTGALTNSDESLRDADSDRPRHVKRIWVDDDKIVLLQAATESEAGNRQEERVQVLRFD